ncbi:MAG: 2-C-methyl-D-erythritol 4-phosphate cytidylyltransferase [Gammaproteobacteria bacterium]
MSELAKIWAVIPAAGIGTRMQTDIPKQYLKIRGKCILEYTLERFCSHPDIQGVIVAVSDSDHYWSTLSIASHKKITRVTGGEERCHSVQNGLHALGEVAAPDDWVMVHDAARPCLRVEDIDKLIIQISKGKTGGLLAVPVRDTMKRANKSNHVKETVDRVDLWHALTPQMFRLSELTGAIDTALQQQLLVTDEAQAMEYYEQAPLLVEGHPDNIKITHPRDLILAELFLLQQEENP